MRPVHLLSIILMTTIISTGLSYTPNDFDTGFFSFNDISFSIFIIFKYKDMYKVDVISLEPM